MGAPPASKPESRTTIESVCVLGCDSLSLSLEGLPPASAQPGEPASEAGGWLSAVAFEAIGSLVFDTAPQRPAVAHSSPVSACGLVPTVFPVSPLGAESLSNVLDALLVLVLVCASVSDSDASKSNAASPASASGWFDNTTLSAGRGTSLMFSNRPQLVTSPHSAN